MITIHENDMHENKNVDSIAELFYILSRKYAVEDNNF